MYPITLAAGAAMGAVLMNTFCERCQEKILSSRNILWHITKSILLVVTGWGFSLGLSTELLALIGMQTLAQHLLSLACGVLFAVIVKILEFKDQEARERENSVTESH